MISLLIVNYRSAELAIEAIRTARASTSSPLQIVVVDNSCDPAEVDALREHADALIASPINRGYAGAINDGRRICDGDVLVVSNPDVQFGAGALDTLAAALADDVAVAGPALYWDDAFSWHLPPSELHTAREKIGEVFASRSRRFAASRDMRRIKQRIVFWSMTETRHVAAISGAVMAIRTSVFDEIGGFDERFALYFEENDFLRQVAERRKRIAYVPAARCRHLYNQSAAQSESAAATYAQSEMRYLAKWNGPFVARLLKRLEKGAPTPQPGKGLRDSSEYLIEASPLDSFATAAGHFTKSPHVEIPDEIWETYRGGKLHLRLIDRATAAVLLAETRYKS
jgi:GT2 family glycosyltransferase